jgi:hypothetical protein
MKTKIVIALALIIGWHVEAQTYDTNGAVVQPFAGSGFSGYVDGVGQLTMFNNPNGIVADSHSNLFVFDLGNIRIRKISPDGTVSTFAGGGVNPPPSYGTNVALYNSWGSMAIDHSNALWTIAYFNSSSYLVRIGNDGFVSTPTNLAALPVGSPNGLCVDSGNNVYISTWSGNQIFRYKTNGVLEVFAGSGNSGSTDGNGIFSSFAHPTALAADAADNIYVWDLSYHLIRRINQNRDVATIISKYSSNDSDGVGTNASFSSVSAMCVDESGNVILACGISIRKMAATTNVTTLAGSFTQSGYTNGAGDLARFSGAGGVCISGGTVFVADSANQRIRQIAFDPQPQVVSGANLSIGTFAGLTISGVVGRTYQVQSSPNMNAWTTRATLLLNSSPYIWIDQNPVAGNKFYRAFLLP